MKYTKLSDFYIQDEHVVKILLSLLDALCKLEVARFPHGAISAENIFVTEKLVLLIGPPEPFLDTELVHIICNDLFTLKVDFI